MESSLEPKTYIDAILIVTDIVTRRTPLRATLRQPPKLCRCGCNRPVNALRASRTLYASNQCQRDHEYRSFIQGWLAGMVEGSLKGACMPSNHIRRFILERDGYQCVCFADGARRTRSLVIGL